MEVDNSDIIDLTVNCDTEDRFSFVDLTGRRDNGKEEELDVDEVKIVSGPPTKRAKIGSGEHIHGTPELEEKRDLPHRRNSNRRLKENLKAASSLNLRILQQKNLHEVMGREYAVIEEDGDVFKVTVSKQPNCTCPSFKATPDNLCKHLFFIYIKVLKLEETDTVILQRALLKSELEAMLSNSPTVPSALLADSVVTQKYLELTSNKLKKEVPQKPIDGNCPICFEAMEGGKESVVYCKYYCGNNVHKKCFEKWAKAKSKSESSQLQCIYCRGRWNPDECIAKYMKNGTLNLSAFTAAPQLRSTPLLPYLWLLFVGMQRPR